MDEKDSKWSLSTLVDRHDAGVQAHTQSVTIRKVDVGLKRVLHNVDHFQQARDRETVFDFGLDIIFQNPHAFIEMKVGEGLARVETIEEKTRDCSRMVNEAFLGDCFKYVGFRVNDSVFLIEDRMHKIAERRDDFTARHAEPRIPVDKGRI